MLSKRFAGRSSFAIRKRVRWSIFSKRCGRRSSISRNKRENQPPVLSLPPEIIHRILLKAGEVPHCHFRRTKKACHKFQTVMEEDWYNMEVDLWEMELAHWHIQEFEDLKERCLQLTNPSAMYITGMKYVFSEGTLEEGLNLIRQASDQGYDLAIYANACLRRIIHPTDQSNDNIPREFIYEAKKKLHKANSIPSNFANRGWLVEKKDLIDVQSIERCNCVPNSGWTSPLKPRGACDACYWKAEAWCFAEKYTTGNTCNYIMAGDANTKFVMINDEILGCLICTDRLTPPIVQCKNGHYVCGKCKDKINKKCPVCRSRISSIRCLAMERVLESARPCPNPNFREVIEVSSDSDESDGLEDPNECYFALLKAGRNNRTTHSPDA